MNWVYKIITWLSWNHGYSTQPQARFNCGDYTTISQFISNDHPFLEHGMIVIIKETCRHDYLIETKSGNKCTVYQHELDWYNRGIDKNNEQLKATFELV